MTTALGTGLRRAAARLAPGHDPTPDGELLARFLESRDEPAFAELVRRHARMVFGTCRRVLGNSADADDSFQAAFVVLVRKAHSLTDRACVGNFLYGVAFHTALKARAMATTRRAKEAKVTRPESADGGEITRVLDEELAKLPDKYREPVVLCELEGVSRKDAAARLGVPEGTISSRLATAHRMLQKRLTARGFASVAVAAVLGNQAFAVPETLAEAAVRAAADGSPAAVTQLATEVSKMLLWNKLKAGAAVLAGVLLLAGFGAMAPGFADDKPAVKAPVPAKAEKKPDDAKLLQGTWTTKTITFDPPQKVGPGETFTPARHTLTFAGTDLTWVSFVTDDPKQRATQTKPFKLDQTTSPKELTSGDNECVYELDGDTLKVAMYFLTPGRPKGFNAKDSPPGKGHVILIELTREKEEADKSYSLKNGEVLKLIAAPFPDERETVFKLAADPHPFKAADEVLMAVTVTDGKPTKVHPFTNRKSPGSDSLGKPLALMVQDGLRTDMAKVADPHWLLDSTVLDADVVLKKGAAPSDLVAALSKELEAMYGVKMTLKFEDTEREVVVITGKHVLRDGETDDGRVNGGTAIVHFFAENQVEHANSLISTSGALPGELAKFVGRPVIDESDLGKKPVTVKLTFHVQQPETDKSRPADRDPAKVIKNLEEQTGLTFKLEKRKVRALVVGKADQANPDRKVGGDEKLEPAWKAEFRKAYGLADSQLVRRVAPPYPDCRNDFLRDLYQQPKGDFTAHSAKFGWKDGWPDLTQMAHRIPVKPEVGVPLDYLLDVTLGFPATRIDDQSGLGQKVTGDFVVRAGADPEKVAVELEKVLQKECELPVKFTFKDVEEEVLVLGGKYKPAPLDVNKPDLLEVFARYRNDGTFGGGGDGTLADLVMAVEKRTGKRIVLGEVANAPKKVRWHFNDRKGPFTPQEGEEDRNVGLVLGNIATQTGLEVTTEKRKVRVLVVTKDDR